MTADDARTAADYLPSPNRRASRLVCGRCGATSDHPGICWPCFDKHARSAKARDAREAANE